LMRNKAEVTVVIVLALTRCIMTYCCMSNIST
jgi:hypothetical protein